ncbi:MAG: GIY-YIG nuclease family protein [Desulfitobacteriia bacterium]
MDKKRKKELLEIYKNRRPEMGVISYRCRVTGEVFLGISKDTKSDFNSINMKLEANWHPNKQLQELWNKYGPEGFELSVVKVLEYDDPHEDHTAKLESLREQCFAADPNARKNGDELFTVLA